MARPRQSHCLRGHEFTPKNTRWSIGSTGNPQRTCRQCHRTVHADSWRLRYRNDAGYREKKKAQAADRRARIKKGRPNEQAAQV